MPKIKPERQVIQRIAVLGDVLPARLERYRTSFEGTEFVLTMRDRIDFEAEVQAVRPHLIILEYPTVHEETRSEVHALLQKSGAAKAVVVYGFGARRVIATLDTDQVTLLRALVDLPELRHIILSTSGERQWALAPSENWIHNDKLGEPSYAPARRYHDDALALIASAASPVQCECPHHLVDLIRSLVAFETYSVECEHREPADTRLHLFLHAITAQVRFLLEGALTQIAAAENIPLPDSNPPT